MCAYTTGIVLYMWGRGRRGEGEGGRRGGGVTEMHGILKAWPMSIAQYNASMIYLSLDVRTVKPLYSLTFEP